MSTLLDWLDRPAPTREPAKVPVASPAPDVRWPGGATTPEVVSLALGLEKSLAGEVFEESDAASQALALVRKWLAAIADHPAHGRNWLAKNKSELLGLLRVALPDLFPPDPLGVDLEGKGLFAAAMRTFPGAVAGVEQSHAMAQRFRALVAGAEAG